MKILFPTDFSQQANMAFEVALRLAKKHKAELHIFHSVETVMGWRRPEYVTAKTATLDPSSQTAMLPEMKKRLAAAKSGLDKAEKQAASEGVHAKTALGYDVTYKEIVDFASDLKVDLIVMGTYGKSGRKKAFIGSNTIQVVRQSNIPVVTINQPFGEKAFDDILFVSDFESVAKDAKTQILLPLLETLGARIHFGYINTPHNFEQTQRSESKMMEAAAAYGIKPASMHIFNHFFVEQGILDLCVKLGFPAIALTTRGVGGIRKVFTFSVAEHIIKEADVPVMVL
jgi:nucleotide-binding universal stress UspA family protein